MNRRSKLLQTLKYSIITAVACKGTVDIEWGGPIGCETVVTLEDCEDCGYDEVYMCACYDALTYEFSHVARPSDVCTGSGGCATPCCGGFIPEVIVGYCPADPDPTTTVPTTTWGYDCGGWDPGSLIYGPTSNVYGIDLGLVSSIENDPTPLFQCDSARVDVSSGLIIDDAVSTDMVYLLGLRNGDILLEVNSMPLGDPVEAFAAYDKLWRLNGATEYELVIERNNSTVYLNYEIIASKP